MLWLERERIEILQRKDVWTLSPVKNQHMCRDMDVFMLYYLCIDFP